MKTMRSDIAKYTILKSKNDNVPLPSHFSATSFTTAPFDNFDNTDRNSLSGTKHTHDTAITIFQVKPQNPICKPKKSTVKLKSIKKRQKVQNFLYQIHLRYHQICLILKKTLLSITKNNSL